MVLPSHVHLVEQKDLLLRDYYKMWGTCGAGESGALVLGC